MPFLMAAARSGRLESVLVSHELGAVMMADGFFRSSRRMAGCALTAGPGALNGLPGAGLALREQTPIFLLSALVPSALDGRGAAQEFDTVRALGTTCKRSARLLHPARASELTSELLRAALTPPFGPVSLAVDAGSWQLPSHRNHRYFAAPAPKAAAVDGMDETLVALRRAERPTLLAGSGVVHARAAEALLALARALPKLRVACTPRAHGAFPTGHPQSLRVFGFAGSTQAAARFEESDLVFVVGSRLGEIATGGWSSALSGKLMIQLDRDAEELGRVYPVDIGLVGDARATVEQLALGLSAGKAGLRETA